MKRKKKSAGSGKFKALILKHVEKAVIALALLFFVLLVLKASKLGGDFDLQPDQLQTASVEADKAIRAPKIGPSSETPPWSQIAGDIKTPVPSWPYGIPTKWMHRLFPGETLRGEPNVFPLEKLRASAGFGGVSISSAGQMRGGGSTMGPGADYEMETGYGSEMGGYGAGGKAEGRRWVVLTGLLPYKRQFMEYGNVFRNAELQDRRLDVPSYSYYDVERAEVTPGVPPEEKDWKKVSVFSDYMERRKKWAGGQPPIINRKFLHSPQGVMPMAYPLPPVVNKTFGPEIAHEPEIPFFYEAERKVEREEIDYKALEDDPDALVKAKALGRSGMGQYGTSGGSYEEESGYYEQDYGESGYGEEYGSGMEMGYGSGMPGMAGRMGPRREIPEYQLFRFFDFTVEKGRYYQYRVRLKLGNPNYELPVQALEDEALAEGPFLDTEWSEPSALVSVPYDSRVLAGLTSVSSNASVAPKAQLGLVFFNAEDGSEEAQKYDVVYRGQLMNFYGVEIEEKKPAAGLGSGYGMDYEMDYEMGSEDMYGGGSGSGRNRREKRRERKDPEEIKKIDFVSNMLVLDFDGGGTLPGPDRQLKAPGRTLVMDPAGNLVLKCDLDCQEEWVEFFPPEVKKKKPETEPGYGEEMMYGSSYEAEY